MSALKSRALSCASSLWEEWGVAENGSPLWYPFIHEALDMEGFISLCGLICLRDGNVPRCGLAPTLLQCERWICRRGLDGVKLKQEFIKTLLHTMYIHAFFGVPSRATSGTTVALIHSRYRRQRKIPPQQKQDTGRRGMKTRKFAQNSKRTDYYICLPVL